VPRATLLETAEPCEGRLSVSIDGRKMEFAAAVAEVLIGEVRSES
jgi:hypothetical protein